MKLTIEQTRLLLESVAGAKSDEIDCDGCYEHLAEFVELELLGRPIPEALRKIEKHIEQCPCCDDEHKALLEALGAVEN